MKFSTTALLLLVFGWCGICTARVEVLPVDLFKDLKLGKNIVDVEKPAVVNEDFVKAVEQPDEKLVEWRVEKDIEAADELDNQPIVEDTELPELPKIVTNSAPEPKAGSCNITIRAGIANPQPVFLKPNTNDFYPYSDYGEMHFNAGDNIEMWCSGDFELFSGNFITASCVLGTIFKVNGKTHDFKEFTCKSWPVYTAEKTGSNCNGGILLRVGFRISSSRFVEQMQICFSEDEEVTRYVRHTLNPGSHFYQTSVDRLTFQTSGFFDQKNVNKLYTQISQKEVINKELGGNADKYFDPSKNIYLARGHMGAKADFVYGSQQRATFLFVNVAPQWQVFNAGNWARMEDGFRRWVADQKLNVNCYTGVWSVTTLPNINGVETPLYLTYDQNHNGLIPVPKLYFRVAIEPATKRGIVFIGVNNPHLTMEQIRKDYIICNDVSDQVTYINWRKTDIVAGYSYACEVSDFLKTVKHLPALTANGGLLV